MATKAKAGAGTAVAEAPAEDVGTSITTDDRIVDASVLVHQALTCKETFVALAKAADTLGKKAGAAARQACGYRLSGRQTMLFDTATEATLRLELDELDLLIEAAHAALEHYQPEE